MTKQDYELVVDEEVSRASAGGFRRTKAVANLRQMIATEQAALDKGLGMAPARKAAVAYATAAVAKIEGAL
jgi:hypothetical protein